MFEEKATKQHKLFPHLYGIFFEALSAGLYSWKYLLVKERLEVP